MTGSLAPTTHHHAIDEVTMDVSIALSRETRARMSAEREREYLREAVDTLGRQVNALEQQRDFYRDLCVRARLVKDER